MSWLLRKLYRNHLATASGRPSRPAGKRGRDIRCSNDDVTERDKKCRPLNESGLHADGASYVTGFYQRETETLSRYAVI
jgi:hypothetical protein